MNRVLPIGLLLIVVPYHLVATEPEAYDRSVQTGLQLVLSHRYAAADSLWLSLMQSQPEHALEAAFLRTASLQMRMYDLDRIVDGDTFDKAVDAVLRLGRGKAVTPFRRDVYSGNALGLRSMFYYLRGDYAAALQAGIDAVRRLEKTHRLDPQALEPLLGLGMFKYWSSTISRRFAWLPMVDDERAEGIAMLRRVTALPQGRLIARNQLAWALMQTGRTDEALQECRSALAEHPDSRFFLWPLAETCLLLERHEEALRDFQMIAHLLERDGLTSEYVYLKALMKAAECALALRRTGEAQTLARQALRVTVHPDHKRKANEWYERAKKIVN